MTSPTDPADRNTLACDAVCPTVERRSIGSPSVSVPPAGHAGGPSIAHTDRRVVGFVLFRSMPNEEF